MSVVVLITHARPALRPTVHPSLIILPITAVFVDGPLLGRVHHSAPGALLLGSVAVLPPFNALLLWMGVRVFQRETILTRWR